MPSFALPKASFQFVKLFKNTTAAAFKQALSYDGRRVYCDVTVVGGLLTFAFKDQPPNNLKAPAGTFTSANVTLSLSLIGRTEIAAPIPINLDPAGLGFAFHAHLDATASVVTIEIVQDFNIQTLQDTQKIDGTLSSVFIQDAANGPYKVIFVDNDDTLNPITVRDIAKHTKLTLIRANGGGSEAGPMALQIDCDP